MTTERAIKTLEKYAIVTKNPSNAIHYARRINEKENRMYEIGFVDQQGTAICFSTRPVDQKSEMQSDYHAESYWDNLTQCIRYAWGIETRKERSPNSPCLCGAYDHANGSCFSQVA